MKRVFALLVLAGLIGQPVRAGLVTFTRTSGEPLTGNPAAGVTTATYDITIAQTSFVEGAFRSFALNIGSDDLAITAFEPDPFFESQFDLFDFNFRGLGIFESEIFLTGASFSVELIDVPIRVGELTVDAAGLGSGTYALEVAASDDSALSTGYDHDRDWLNGGTFVSVGMPEPATLWLLGLAVAAVLGRRRISRSP